VHEAVPPGEYVPAAHVDGQAEVAPAAPAQPGLTSRHAPPLTEYVPARQEVQVPPATDDWPAGQGVQVVVPPGEEVPAAHWVGHAVVAPAVPEHPGLIGEHAAAPPME